MTPRSPLRMLAGHCDRYIGTLARVPSGGKARFGEPLYGDPTRNRRALAGNVPSLTWVARAGLPLTGPRIARPSFRPPRTAHQGRTGRLEDYRDLRRSNPCLRRLRRGVHPLGRRPGVLRAEGVLQRPQALHQLSGQPSGCPRWRLGPSRYRWPAGLRARRRPSLARVLRGRLFVVWQPGPGPIQAPDGPPGVLLRLLSDSPTRLTAGAGARIARAPERGA